MAANSNSHGPSKVQVLIVLAMVCNAYAGKDYYRILGIPRSANQNQIKRAYRKMSMKWHPDKNQDNKEQAQKKFVDISTAYEVLSDPKKKAKYDKFGEEGLKEGAEGGGGGAGTFQGQDAFKLFEQFFGKGGNPFGGMGGAMGGGAGGGNPFGGMGGAMGGGAGGGNPFGNMGGGGGPFGGMGGAMGGFNMEDMAGGMGAAGAMGGAMGGFQFPGGGGGPGRGGPQRGGGSGVSLKGLENVEELSEKIFKAKFEGPAADRRSLVVVFYQAGCDECKELREAFKEFGEKFVVAGLAELASVNCARQKSLCQAEAKGAAQPVVNYYGPGAANQKAKRHPAGTISFKSLSTWYTKVMADFCEALPDLGAIRKWLASNDKVPHTIFFSDKKTTPPLIKKLSIEFNGRAAMGIVLAGADTEVATRFGVTSRPALVHVLDEDSFESDRFDKEFKKDAMTSFLSRAVGKHRQLADSALRELTPSRFGNGDCSPSDSNFCVILLRPKAGASGASARDALRQLARRAAKDPVKVFIVRDAGFSRAFNQAPGTVVLFRPKRKRFKVFTGDVGNADELISFVDAAVGGGSPLPETLSESPTMKEEL